MGLCILKNKVPKNYFTFCIGKFFILIVCTKSWIYIWRIIFISKSIYIKEIRIIFSISWRSLTSWLICWAV